MPLAQQTPPKQIAQVGCNRQGHIVIALLLSERRWRRDLGVDVVFEFFEGQHALGHRRRVEPIDALTAIELIEGLQVIAALQRQNRALALDPAFRLHRFVIEVWRASLAPGFILRESLGSLGVSPGGSRFIALAQRQFCP
ncbi:hypothetical protein D3C80_997310 [compost metagenome]